MSLKVKEYSQYKNVKAREVFLDLYSKALELWPIKYESLMIDTSFGRTHIIRSGPSNSEPILLIPGGNANATMWYANVKELASTHQILALDTIDAPGRSEPIMEINTEKQYIDWIDEVIEKMSIKKVNIMGISLGGWMALKYAISFPDKILKVLLLDPITTFAPLKISFILHIIIPFMLFPSRKTLKRFNDWLNDGFVPDKTWTEQFINGILYFKPQKVRPTTISKEEFRMIKYPVLLLLGERNKVCDLRTVKRNVTQFGHTVDMEIIKGASHSLQFEQADYVNRRINEFINK